MKAPTDDEFQKLSSTPVNIINLISCLIKEICTCTTYFHASFMFLGHHYIWGAIFFSFIPSSKSLFTIHYPLSLFNNIYFRWLTKGPAVDPFCAIKKGPDTQYSYKISNVSHLINKIGEVVRPWLGSILRCTCKRHRDLPLRIVCLCRDHHMDI